MTRKDGAVELRVLSFVFEYVYITSMKEIRKKRDRSSDRDRNEREKKDFKDKSSYRTEKRRHERSTSRERRKSKKEKVDKYDDDYYEKKRSRSDSKNSDKYDHRGGERVSKRYWDENKDPPSQSYRKNSDKYWNKYSREDQVVGLRYYESLEAKKKKRSSSPRESIKEDDEKPVEEKKMENINESKEENNTSEATKTEMPKKPVNPITSRTGGAYIPPAKLKMMQAAITDKSSVEYQRIAWEALKKSIHGLINKVNTSNIAEIIKELLRENIVRGRGLLCKSIIQAQALSPTFTHVYAALVALINSRFPNIGELLLRRLVLQFKRGYRRNDKSICVSSTTFIAHLVNQRVAHEIIALEILTLLVETPTDHSIEIAISFLKECGMRLTEVSSKGIEAIFQMLRNILHEGKLDRRVDYMIEVILQIRKDNFKDHEAIIESLDLVEEEDQFTHIITLEDATNSEDILNVFKFDPQYIENEDKYKALSKEMLGESDDSDGSSSGGSGSSSEEEDSDEENEDDEEKKQLIIDRTETNLVSLRRTIYLTIYSSLDYEECAHKLMKMELKPGQEVELCNMILDCCCEMRTYEKFFGLLAQRFTKINKMYVEPFQNMFRDSYETVYRLKPNQLRNVAKFFAHLLFTDAISWGVLSCIRLNEEDTTSSGRIFIKIVFQELSEHMGLTKLNERVKDITLSAAFCGLFPRDNPKNTRFAINFFTSIGLGGLTDDLREHLKGQTKPEVFEVQPAVAPPPKSPSESESSTESSSSESASGDSSSSESESESESSSDSDSASSGSDSSSDTDKESNSSSDDDRRRKKSKSKVKAKKKVKKSQKAKMKKVEERKKKKSSKKSKHRRR